MNYSTQKSGGKASRQAPPPESSHELKPLNKEFIVNSLINLLIALGVGNAKELVPNGKVGPQMRVAIDEIRTSQFRRQFAITTTGHALLAGVDLQRELGIDFADETWQRGHDNFVNWLGGAEWPARTRS